MKERVKRMIALLLTVVMTVSVMPTTLAVGNAVITTQTEKTAAVAPGDFANEQGDVAPVTSTAGQITVSAPATNDCTVIFHDGTSSVVSKTVAKDTVIARTDLPAEPTKNGYIFAGWYEAGVTGATNDVVSGSSFTGKEFRPKYDIVTASADYYALWISKTGTAAIIRDNTTNVATIYSIYANVQTVITSSLKNATIKMLSDCAEEITIPATADVTLDMNGHSITTTAGHGIHVTGGTLSVENSSGSVAAFTTNQNGIEVESSGHLPLLRDIWFKDCSNGVRLWAGTIDRIENCDISGSGYGIVTQADFGTNPATPSTISDIINTKLTGGEPVNVNPGSSVHVTTAKMKSTRPFNTADLSRVTLPAGKTWGAADAEGYYSVVDGFTIFLFKETGDSFVEGIYVPIGTTPVSTVTPPEKPGSDMLNDVFDGWADANGTKQTIGAITANTTLYATYREEAKPMVAQVGETKYTSVNLALNAITATVGKTGTIKLLTDVIWDHVPKCLSVPAGANITLDFAGHKISANANTPYDVGQITNSGTLKLTSTGATRGTIEALHDIDTVVYNRSSGKLIVQNLNILGEQCSIRNVGGTVDEISGCKLAPDATSGAITAGLQNDYGTVTLVADTESTSRICNGNGEGNAPAMLTTLRNVTIGTPMVLADVGIENADNSTITTIENCTIYAASMAIFNRGVKAEPGTIGNVIGGRFYSKCDATVTKPVAADDVVYAAVVNYGNGDLTLSGGAYKGGLNAQGNQWGVAKQDIKFATGKVLSAFPDAQGYYAVMWKIDMPKPILPAGSTTLPVVVPDEPLDTQQPTTIDAKSGDPDATETEVTFSATTVGSMGTAEELEIDTDDAAVIFDKLALRDIKTNATTNTVVAPVKLKVAEQTFNDLKQAQQAAAANATKILDLKLTKADGTTAVAFGGGSAKIVVPYTKVNTDPAFVVKVYHIADDGTKTERADASFDVVTGKLTFTTQSFSTYMAAEEIGAQGQYTMTVETTARHYNPGDTITANIVATTPVASNFGSFGFTLDYDKTKLTLVSLTTPLAGNTAIKDGKLGCVISGAPTAVDTTGLIIATATFTVKTGVTAGDSIVTLTNPEMTYSGTSKCPTPTVVPKTVHLDNLKVTFAQGTGSTMSAATAYAKYNVAGLWTSDSYATAFTFPSPVATDGYRLDTAQPWGKADTGYTEAGVTAMVFTADAAFTARAVKIQKVSFAASTGGMISSTTQQTIDKGASLSTLTLPTVTSSSGYTFTGWHDGTSIIDTATYVVNADITLTAKFAANKYTWEVKPAIVGATMNGLTGVIANEVTYGTPVTFTLTPSANYVVTAVSYAVGINAATSLTPAENGTYTIPGTAILGNITLEITTQKYYTVTFQAGAGTTLTTAIAYAKAGAAGLFTDKTMKTSFTVPTPTVQAGYRLAADTTNEYLWKDAASTGYTSTSIAGTALTADTVLTAQAVKTYVVKFLAGANGALTVKPLTLTVDTGYTLKAEDVPTPNPNSGYQFSTWTATDPVGQSITADTTYTATFAHGTYAITFSGGGSNVTFTEQTGVIGSNATHGTAVTFQITTTNGYKVTAVKSTIGSTTKTLIASDFGVYTIPGDEIVDGVSVTAESTATYTVKFQAGANGTLVNGNQNFVFDKDHVITAGEIPGTAPNSGYVFREWQAGSVAQSPENHQVIAAITFTAVFEQGKYAVTMPDAAVATVTVASGLVTGNATHGTDLVFTVACASGKLVNKVSYQIADGAVTELTIGAKGQFTILGSAITAPITISVDTLDGTIAFVGNDTYRAIAAGKQMVVFTTTKLIGTNTYSLVGGTELYWSGKYNAYVCFASVAETAATISTQLGKLTNKETVEISYTGDIEGTNPGVGPADGLVINDILHNQSKEIASDMRRFQLDVNGDKKVTTVDIQVILNTYAGIGV